MTQPLHSDDDFSLNVTVMSGNDPINNIGSYTHPVVVRAVADKPVVVSTQDIVGVEDGPPQRLSVVVNSSADVDNSEYLSIRFTVPSETTPIGTLSFPGGIPSGYSFTNPSTGVFVLTPPAGTPIQEAVSLNSAFTNSSGLVFTPRPQWSGVRNGTNGIMVQIISTETRDGTSENATGYIGIKFDPATETITMKTPTSTVSENNCNNAGSAVVTVPIGQNMNLTNPDRDGSEYVEISLTGFLLSMVATNAFTVTVSPPVVYVKSSDSNVTTLRFSGPSNEVLNTIRTLSFALTDDGDVDFNITVTGNMTDSSGATNVTAAIAPLTHQVIVRGAADLPTVSVPSTVTINENSAARAYPVNVSLNDNDGSETLGVQFTVTLDRVTAGTQWPNVTFANASATVVASNSSTSRIYTVSGAVADVQSTVSSLTIQPGPDNGEDVNVTVLATATETSSNNCLNTANMTASFRLEVKPMIREDNLAIVLPVTSVNGTEANRTDLGNITVISTPALNDTDNSEQIFMLVDTLSYPSGSTFYFNNVLVTGSSVTYDGRTYLQLPANQGSVSILTPTDFSGPFNMVFRGFIIDTAFDGDTAVNATATQNITVNIAPIADCLRFTNPTRSFVVEDLQGAGTSAPVGTDIANGYTVNDDGNPDGGANNVAREYLSRFVLQGSALNFTATPNLAIAGTPVTGLGPGQTGVLVYDSVSNTVTISSASVDGNRTAGTLGLLDPAQLLSAENDILAVLRSVIASTSVGQSDINQFVLVNSTTVDVNPDLDLAHEFSCSHNHTVLVKAYADNVTVTTNNITFNQYTEDDVRPGVSWSTTGIPLSITVASSIDNQDASETLDVQITIPYDNVFQGVIGTLNYTGSPGSIVFAPVGMNAEGMVYAVRSTQLRADQQQTDLNNFFATQIKFWPAKDWSGLKDIKVVLTTTEKETAALEVEKQAANSTAYIFVDVLPRADPPIVLIKGNAIGIEDVPMSVPIEVRVTDRDSENFLLVVRGSSVPVNSTLYGANNATLAKNANGDYVLTPADVAVFRYQAPLHWSDYSGSITLVTYVNVTDTTPQGKVDTIQTLDYSIPVKVRGVADKPTVQQVTFFADEDVPYPIGEAIEASIGFSNILVDRDGSETLTFRITGLGDGSRLIVPDSLKSQVNYLGASQGYELSLAAMRNATLLPEPHYSGITTNSSTWYKDIRITATTQEVDGDVAFADPWPVNIQVRPVVNQDGLGNLFPSYSVTESENELSDTGVRLIALKGVTDKDSDGSEYIVDYNLDLRTMMDDAKIRKRLQDLNPNATVDFDLLLTYLVVGDGAYVKNSNQTITVYADRGAGFGSAAGGLRFRGTLFWDSNVDFYIPFRARIRDQANLVAGPYIVETTQSGNFTISISGVADKPIVTARDVDGPGPLLLDFNGTFNDTDPSLLRDQSEEIYYFIEENLVVGNISEYSFVNATNHIVGYGAGGGTWFFSQSDLLQQIYLIAPAGAEGNITFNFTAATQEDGTDAFDSAKFTVQVRSSPGLNSIPPYPPIVTIGANNIAQEDGDLVLNISLTVDPRENTSVALSLAIYDLDPQLTIDGEAYYNPFTRAWVMSKDALDRGAVTITAPGDFSGSFGLNIQGFAANVNFLKNSTANMTIPLQWTPVGDGPSISATAKSENLASSQLLEDSGILLNVTMAERDVDGSEDIGEWVVVEFGADFNMRWNYSFTGPIYSFGPFIVDGIPITNGINISRSVLNQLKLTPFSNWHGKIPIKIHGFTTEQLDRNVIGWNHASFEFEVEAVADIADLFANSTITVSEFNRTSLAGLLSANRTDIIEDNGKELISVKLLNVPVGSQFFLPGSSTRYGGFVEPGVYSIPEASQLPFLEYLGPEFVSGTFEVTLSAITIESSNFDEFTTNKNFTLVIKPTASGFLILSKDISVDASGIKPLDLSVRVLDQQGTTLGETPPEVVELFFSFPPTANDTVFLRPTLGGHLSRTGSGSWTFRGTQSQANAIEVVNVGLTGTVDVGVVGRTYDSGTVSALSTDDFDFQATFTTLSPLGQSLTVVNPVHTGTAGNDFFKTTAGAVQTISGGAGADIFYSSSGPKTMTGGLGADQFVWPDVASVGGARDRITDFNPAQGDQLNLGGLLNFNVQTDLPANFLRLTGSTLQVSPNGNGTGWTDVVILDGVTSLNVAALYASGNLLL